MINSFFSNVIGRLSRNCRSVFVTFFNNCAHNLVSMILVSLENLGVQGGGGLCQNFILLFFNIFNNQVFMNLVESVKVFLFHFLVTFFWILKIFLLAVFVQVKGSQLSIELELFVLFRIRLWLARVYMSKNFLLFHLYKNNKIYKLALF